MIKRVLLLAIVAVVLIAALVLSQQRDEPLKVSGFIEADEIRLGSRLGGRVQSVHVEEGQFVERGTLLVELEPFDMAERLQQELALLQQRQARLEELQSGYRPEETAQAKARVDQLQAHLDKLRAGPREQEIAAATDQLELAKAELQLATQNHSRIQNLFGRGLASEEDMDAAETQLKVAEARVEARTEELALLEEGTREEDLRQAEAQLEEAQQAWLLLKNGYRPTEITQARAAVDAAAASVAAVKQQLAELRIVAPVDGSIEAVELQTGDMVAPNAPAISMLDLSNLWVRAYVPENQLRIKVGQIVAVSVDSYPDRRYRAKITYIAKQAEFTPGNVQTPEDRSKQVFRVNVTLLEGLEELRPGMAADVWLEDGAQ